MEQYDDVTLTEEGSWWHCDRFEFDETTRELRFKNINPGENLWSLPIQGTIGVTITRGSRFGRFV